MYAAAFLGKYVSYLTFTEFFWLVSLKGSISRAFLVQTERVVHMGRGTRAR